MTNTLYASDWDQSYRPSYAKIRRTVVLHIQVHLVACNLAESEMVCTSHTVLYPVRKTQANSPPPTPPPPPSLLSPYPNHLYTPTARDVLRFTRPCHGMHYVLEASVFVFTIIVDSGPAFWHHYRASLKTVSALLVEAETFKPFHCTQNHKNIQYKSLKSLKYTPIQKKQS